MRKPFFIRGYLLLVFLLFAGSAIAQTSPLAPAGSPPPSEIYATASDGTPLTWSVYTPVGSAPWPVVLVIHGGQYVSGTPNDYGPAGCAQDLADAGYLAFSIAYRLAPPGSIPGQTSSGRYPEQYDDVQLAVMAARADSRGNGLVGCVGGSAGGTHMSWVAATGRSRERIDVGVGLSGAYDFSDFSPDPNIGPFIKTVTNYVGVPSTDTADLQAASPAWNLDRKVAPLFLVDSEGDLMPAAQLDDMVAHLREVRARNYQAMTIPGNGHSFDNWPFVKDEAIAFLAAVLNPPRR